MHRRFASVAFVCACLSFARAEYGVHSLKETIEIMEWKPGQVTDWISLDDKGKFDAVDFRSQFLVIEAKGKDGEGKENLTWEVCARQGDARRLAGSEEENGVDNTEEDEIFKMDQDEKVSPGELDCFLDAASHNEDDTSVSAVFGYDVGCVPYTAGGHIDGDEKTECPNLQIRFKNTSDKKIIAGVDSVVGMILHSTRNEKRGVIGGAWAARLRSVYKHIYAIPLVPGLELQMTIKGKVLPSEGMISMLASSKSPLDYEEIKHTNPELEGDQVYDFPIQDEFEYKLLWVLPTGTLPDNRQLEYEMSITGPKAWYQQNWIFIVMIVIASVAVCGALIMALVLGWRGIRRLLRRRRERRQAASARVERENFLEALELKTFAEMEANINKEDAQCCICMEDYEKDSVLQILHCNHHFHKDCVGRWLEDHWSCPLCNQNIQSAENHYNRAAGEDGKPAVEAKPASPSHSAYDRQIHIAEDSGLPEGRSSGYHPPAENPDLEMEASQSNAEARMPGVARGSWGGSHEL